MKNSRESLKHIRISILLVVLVLITGTVGYILIEGWNLIDSFYMTVISITTTGFAEVNPLSATGKIFTAFLIVLGLTTIGYTLGRFTQYFVEEYIFRRRRMKERIKKLKDHYIVCGFGRMGKQICKELAESDIDFVVIENNPEKIEELKDSGYLLIEGDATDDEILREAGIERAKGLVSVVDKDADNVFVTLSARGLNDKILIVTRAISENTEKKLYKAGANRVIKPYELGGHRMVQMLLRPYVVDFIDIIGRRASYNLVMEEIPIREKSSLVGLTLSQTPIRKELNIIVVAIYSPDGKFHYNPGPNTHIQVEDTLIVIGEEKNIKKLKEIASSGIQE